MAQTKCIYRSVALEQGEIFSLPPGAELLYVSDPASIISSCDVDLPTTELQCYMFQALSDGKHFGNSTDFGIARIILDDIEVYIDPSQALLGGFYPTAVTQIANTIWNTFQSSPYSALLAAVQVGVNVWNDGDQFGIILKIPNIFTKIQIMIVDFNNYNLVSNNPPDNSIVYSIGVPVDCDITSSWTGSQAVVTRGTL